MGDKRVRLEVWPLAADRHTGIWLLSGAEPLLSGNVPADAENHAEVQLMLAKLDVDPVMIHTTSCRDAPPAQITSYVAIAKLAPDELVLDRWRGAKPVDVHELLDAVGKPWPHEPADPPLPRDLDVLLHALRHLEFLRRHDSGAARVLVEPWADHLAPLEPALAMLYREDAA